MKTRLSSLMISTAPYALNAAGEGSGGTPVPAPTPAAPAADPATILFGGDKPKEPPADAVKPADPAAPKADDAPKPEDWKEYENDPAKTPEENAALKAEHDAKKPKEDDKKADADKVPADGKYDFKMPDGIELDKELADALGPEFAAANITNAQAQKIVDRYIEHETNRTKTHLEKPEGQWSMAAYQYFKDHGSPDAWPDKAKADPEIGGTNWDAATADAVRAVNTFGTPALKEYLQASGGGNHVELIRVFAKVGKLVKEDSPAPGGAAGAGKPVDAAHVLFPNDAPKG